MSDWLNCKCFRTLTWTGPLSSVGTCCINEFRSSRSALEAVRCLGIFMATRLVLASFLLSSFCFADLRYRMHTTGRPTPTPDRIVYVRGDRIRTEFPDTGRVNIRQCDLSRIVHIDPQTKIYRVEQIE